jgi:hypothetical protein
MIHDAANTPREVCNCCHGTDCPTHIGKREPSVADRIVELLEQTRRMQREYENVIGQRSPGLEGRIKGLQDALQIVAPNYIA